MNFVRNKNKLSVSLSGADLAEGKETLARLLSEVPLADPPALLIISARGADDCGWVELKAILSLVERAKAGGLEVELRFPDPLGRIFSDLGILASAN